MFRKSWMMWSVLAVFLTADMLLLLSVVTAPATLPPLDPTFLPTAQYLAQNRMERPNFVNHYHTHGSWYARFGGAIFININQEPFARIGITADELWQHLSKSYLGNIDGVPAKTETMSYFTLTCDDLRQTDVSKSRCWGGEMVVYFDVSSLDYGLHWAEIIITDLEGVPHNFSWAFRLSETDPFPTSTPTA